MRRGVRKYPDPFPQPKENPTKFKPGAEWTGNAKGTPGNFEPNRSQKVAKYRNALFSEEIREGLREGLRGVLPVMERILSGKPATDGNPDPTANEVIAAFKAVAPYTINELKPVMDEAICRVLAEELANDERIPFEAIGDVVSKVIQRLGTD